jgi:urease accessory protein
MTAMQTPPRDGRKVVSGRLDLAFAADADGRTFLRRQYASYPFHVCRAQYLDPGNPGLATLYLQSCSGGIYEDDRLDLSLSLASHAEAHISTQSATVVHSMPSGNAEQSVRIRCEPGSYLEYLPDPQILFPDSRCRSEIYVRLEDNAVALVSDAFLRHDPAGHAGTFAAYHSEIVVESADGAALAVDRLKIDGEAFRDRRPGIAGSFAAQGTLIVAGLEIQLHELLGEVRTIKPDRSAAAVGTSRLPNSAGVLVRVLAADGAALKHALHEVWCAARTVLKGARPAARRK